MSAVESASCQSERPDVGASCPVAFYPNPADLLSSRVATAQAGTGKSEWEVVVRLCIDSMKLAQHRCDVRIRFLIDTKLHPITSNAGQVVCDTLVGCARFQQFEDRWRVTVILIDGFGDAAYADGVPSP